MAEVRESAAFIAANAVHVKLGDEDAFRAAAKILTPLVNGWKPENWAACELHPTAMIDASMKAAWIFLIDTLNFAFWTPPGQEAFAVAYNGRVYTGYWSLCSAIRRALDEGAPILDASFWKNSNEGDWKRIFRSDSSTEIPLFADRVKVIHEAGKFLIENYEASVYKMIQSCGNSALSLISLIHKNLSSYRDECTYKSRPVYFLKRAQILASDLHFGFALDNDPVVNFRDIMELTMFADYRVPQVLNYFGLLRYSETLIRELNENPHLASGSDFECEIRGCSIEAVERLKKYIGENSIAVVIDYALWDYAKANSSLMEHIPIHKTESVFY
jgi:hypothetical protein